MRWRAGARWGVLVGALAALTTPAAAPAAGVDWATYGFSVGRSGFNPSEHTLSPANVGSLRQRWSVDMGGLVHAQPLLASGLKLSPTETTDVVFAGSESGRLVAVRAATGALVWSRELGSVHVPECTATYGITSTPVLDRARGSIYVAAADGVTYELNLVTGATKRKWTISTNLQHEHIWSGLTLARGILYVPVAGDCDNPPYRGRVAAIDTATGKRVATWFVTGKNGPDGGGIWGWGGVSADPSANAIYAVTGNSVTASEHDGYSERVVRLTGKLDVKASHHPGLPLGDADFGAAATLYRAKDCPRQLAVGNKFGAFYVYDRDKIQNGPTQTIQLGGSGDGNDAMLTVAAYWRPKRMLYVANPATHGKYAKGILAFRVKANCRLTLAWHADGPGRLTSSPTVANGVVYYGDGFHAKLVAFDARTGKRLWISKKAVNGPVFNAPSVVGGALYAGSWDRRLHAFTLPSAAFSSSR